MKIQIRTILLLLIFITLLLASEGFRWWWFQNLAEPSKNTVSLKWNIPPQAVDLQLAKTPAGKLLRYDKGVRVLIEDPQTRFGTEVHYLEYRGGNNRVVRDLYGHSPEICLPNSGVILIRELSPQDVKVSEEELHVRRWLFRHPLSQQAIYVFKMIWSSDEAFMDKGIYSIDPRKVLVTTALERRQSAPANMLLAVTMGIGNDEEAWNNFESTVLAHLVKGDSAKR